MKKTKIICTLGPSCMDDEKIRDMIMAGMDVARINLSHSSHDFAEKMVNKIRKLNKELNKNVGILFDTRGPEIRIGTLKGDQLVLNDGDVVVLTPNEADGTNNIINISERKLSLDLDIDSKILLDDGLIELRVIGIKNTDITCKVVHGGILRNNKGVNIPNTNLNMDFLSLTDKNDILFASKLNVDFLALSFVRNANDVLDVNDMLITERNEHMQIISKIECLSAIEDLENIIKVSDGTMVARGDLGIEIEIEKLPCIQKQIVSKTKEKNKISIVATEMLSSMEVKATPTRAEVSDIANAVIDGVDAVMLSGETAVGMYPIPAVELMSKVITETERNLDYHKILMERYEDRNYDSTTVLAYTAVDAANMVKAKAIVVSTMSGYTARRVSNYRPNCPIIVVTPTKEIAESLSLNYGVFAISAKRGSSTDEIIDNAKKIAKDILNLEKDDKLIITGGFPLKKVRTTNFVKIEEI